LLRFLFATRRLKHDLGVSVVAPARRPFDRPPRALPWSLIKKTLRSIDTNTAMGARDRAQFLLMSACGLGAAEVLHLQLGDIDWAGRRLRVIRQKTKNVIWLPLLPEVGRALARYIRRFRPRPSASCRVFLSSQMPHRPFVGSSILRHRVSVLAKRAGVSGRVSGTHVFRHSHATRHVILGTSAKTLSDILGHRDPRTTSIYTRAALQRLRRLALPVPK
jgi:integrase